MVLATPGAHIDRHGCRVGIGVRVFPPAWPHHKTRVFRGRWRAAHAIDVRGAVGCGVVPCCHVVRVGVCFWRYSGLCLWLWLCVCASARACVCLLVVGRWIVACGVVAERTSPNTIHPAGSCFYASWHQITACCEYPPTPEAWWSSCGASPPSSRTAVSKSSSWSFHRPTRCTRGLNSRWVASCLRP